jgi:hypothetical protein
VASSARGASGTHAGTGSCPARRFTGLRVSPSEGELGDIIVAERNSERSLSMHVRSTIGVLLACSLAVVPLGAQGHSGGPHGNPHAQGGKPGGATPAPQGPKNPNPGAGHSQKGSHADGAGDASKAGKPEGDHGRMTIPEHLAAQPQLSQRLQGMLPAGMTVEQASAGFKNLGQFMAAVNVSKNLSIPFDQLKAQVTGSSAKSLGAAIHTLKPDADATGEVERAETAAHDMTHGSKK